MQPLLFPRPAIAGLLFLALSAAACRAPEPPAPAAGPHFVTTIHPFEAILREVVGTRGAVHNLLPAGTSPHTHDPRPSDVRNVATGTALFYGSEHLDAWAAGLDAPVHIALLGLVPDAYRLPLPEGVTDEHGHDSAIDPHFWTDPLAVRAMVPPLADTLCALDAGGCTTYRTNADRFAAVLDTLDARLQAALEPVRETPVFLAQPFFQYFLKRYGLRLVRVIEPIPGKEATPRLLQELIEQAQTTHVAAIFTLPQLPSRAAEVVGETAALPIYQLDPLGGVEGRETYSDLLWYNARIIRDALRPSAE